MSKNNKPKTIYLFIILLTVIVSITGATYAYWTASANSVNNAVQTSSTIYSISMEITQLYSGFSFIPMNDDDALKALKNECKDKYDRGACAAYKIRVYDYNEDLNFISGFMNINTKNMENISYMMYRISDELDEDNPRPELRFPILLLRPCTAASFLNCPACFVFVIPLATLSFI